MKLTQKKTLFIIGGEVAPPALIIALLMLGQ